MHHTLILQHRELIFRYIGLRHHVRALVAAVAVIACGGDGTAPQAPPAVATIAIAPTTAEVETGDTTRITATARSANGAVLTDRLTTWTSSQPTIVSVSATGLVTGLAVGGPVTISAAIDGVVGVAGITVTRARVSTVAITPTTPTVAIAKTLQLTAVTRDARGNVLTEREVTWSSADPSIVSISAAGLATGVALGGPVVVTARSEGKEATAEVRVVPAPVANISVTAPTSEVNDGATVQLTARLTDASGNVLTGRTVTWFSDSTHLATVDDGGLVRTQRAGVAPIRARADGVEGTASLTIRGLVHRWSFDEQGGPGTTLRDDLRGARGSIVRGGTLAASAQAGQVTLTGGARGEADYVALAAGLLRPLSDATIEVWATLHSRKNWSRVFDIGSGPGNNLFIAWTQGTSAALDRTAFTVGGVENRLDNAWAPFAIDLQHHIVMSIDDGGGSGGKTRVSIYLDGVARGAFETSYRLRDLADDDFWLGRSHYNDETANASYDEVRIHDRVYSATEIQTLFARGPVRAAPASLAILPPGGMRDTIRGLGARFPLRIVGKDALGRQYPVVPTGLQWTSSNPSVAAVDESGIVRALTIGRTEIRAMMGSTTVSWTAEVVGMRRVSVDPYLSTPIANAIWEIPVVLIEYLPTADGFTIDTLKNPDFYVMGPMSLDSAEKRILTYAKRRKMSVEEGSRFHGYRDGSARPSLGYRVVEHIIVYELVPPSERRDARIIGAPRYPNWFRVFADLQLEPLMRQKRVKEIWFADSGMDGGYPSYNPAVHRVEDFRVNFESNMASPVTGDISNSFREPDDLPVLDHTYIVYGINYRRTQAEAVHNVGHQLEAMMSYVAARQMGHDRLFWYDFVGVVAPGQFGTGRAGWTHMPPNTNINYDYLNKALVASDIEDWRPDNSGQKKMVNSDTWGSLRYPWPGEAEFEQRIESQWYTYWFQNFPGHGNRIPLGNFWISNWWAMVGDWDGSIRSGLGLYSATPAASIGSNVPYAHAQRHDASVRSPGIDDRRRAGTNP